MRPATDDEWDTAWSGSPHATFFESRWWAEAWSRYTGGQMHPTPYAQRYPGGATVVIPASVDSRLGGIARLTRLSPGETYGGWLGSEPLTSENAAALRDFLASSLGNVRWIVNPFLARSTGVFAPADDHTLAIELVGGFDGCRAGWSEGHRRNATKARRAGVVVRVATSADDWRGYFEAYQDSLRRWGSNTTSTHGWALFEELARLDESLVRLWIAVVDGEVAAGALCFYHPAQVNYWHGAAKERFFALRPSNLVMEEAIRDAFDRGAEWFDLGPSGGHAGVEHFKRGFNPVALDVPLIDRSRGVIGVARELRHLVRVGRQRVRRLARP